MNCNIKSLLATIAKERDKTRFAPFFPDVEAAMQPLMEKTVRENFDRVLKRVSREAWQGDNNNNDSNKKGNNASEPQE